MSRILSKEYRAGGSEDWLGYRHRRLAPADGHPPMQLTAGTEPPEFQWAFLSAADQVRSSQNKDRIGVKQSEGVPRPSRCARHFQMECRLSGDGVANFPVGFEDAILEHSDGRR
jgi:hypothetical protein